MNTNWKKILIKAGIVIVLIVGLHFLFNYLKQKPVTNWRQKPVVHSYPQTVITFGFADPLRNGYVSYNTETKTGKMEFSWKLDPFHTFFIDFELEEYELNDAYWMSVINELLSTEKLQYRKKGAFSTHLFSF